MQSRDPSSPKLKIIISTKSHDYLVEAGGFDLRPLFVKQSVSIILRYNHKPDIVSSYKVIPAKSLVTLVDHTVTVF